MFFISQATQHYFIQELTQMPLFHFEMDRVLNNSHLPNDVVVCHEYMLYAEYMSVFIAERIINTLKMLVSYATH